MMASLMAGKAPMGSLCAPPSGSGMISSMILKLISSGLVMRSASVACGASQVSQEAMTSRHRFVQGH